MMTRGLPDECKIITPSHDCVLLPPQPMGEMTQWQNDTSYISLLFLKHLTSAIFVSKSHFGIKLAKVHKVHTFFCQYITSILLVFAQISHLQINVTSPTHRQMVSSPKPL